MKRLYLLTAILLSAVACGGQEDKSWPVTYRETCKDSTILVTLSTGDRLYYIDTVPLEDMTCRDWGMQYVYPMGRVTP